MAVNTTTTAATTTGSDAAATGSGAATVAMVKEDTIITTPELAKSPSIDSILEGTPQYFYMYICVRICENESCINVYKFIPYHLCCNANHIYPLVGQSTGLLSILNATLTLDMSDICFYFLYKYQS